MNVAGAQEVVLSTSGGLGEAETGGVILNVIPREGGNTFSGTSSRPTARTARCRGATTPSRCRTRG